MPFLTVAGITVEVGTDGATEREPVRVGQSTRAFAGTLRSTVRAERRQWAFITGPLTPAAAATLRAAVANGAFVACAGDALGASVTCEVTVADAPYVQDTAATVGFVRRLALVLAEV